MRNWIKTPLIPGTALGAIFATALSLPIAASADERPELVIENFVGTLAVENAPGPIRIVSEDNMGDVRLAETSGGGLRIDGGIKKPDGKKCRNYYMRWSFNSRSGQDGGYEDIEDYPNLVITAPANTVFVVRNAIPFMDGEDFGGADVALNHCGKVRLGDINGDANIEIKGTGDFDAGRAGDVTVQLSGSGDVSFDDVARADLSLRGSGDIELGHAQSLTASMAGSGDIDVDNVNGPADISLAGSGDYAIGNIAGDFSAELRGSGDILVQNVTGERVNLRVSGSGDIELRGGDVRYLDAKSSGSADILYRGSAQNAELHASGSGDITVDEVTGELSKSSSGSADITVRRRNN